MENLEQNEPPQPAYQADRYLDDKLTDNPLSTYPTKEKSPWMVLGILTFLALGGMIVTNLLVMVIGLSFGYDMTKIMNILGGEAGAGDGSFLRLSLLMQHVFLFFLPAVLTLWICYKQKAYQAAALDKRPLSISIVLGILWLIVSMALIQYTYQINKAIPLPKMLMANEDNVKKTMDALFSLKGFAGAFINTLLIGVMPAITEELLFRGVIQRQLGRLLHNDHAQVWITAAFFSAIHFQFQGFLPRMILGALLGYMLVWSRSLWVPVVVHGVNNGMQVLALYAVNMKPDEIEKLEEGKSLHWSIAGISLMFVLILGKYFREKHAKDFQKLTTEGTD
jgi:uncharacterized protein